MRYSKSLLQENVAVKVKRKKLKTDTYSDCS